jgi:hypothetical protein
MTDDLMFKLKDEVNFKVMSQKENIIEAAILTGYKAALKETVNVVNFEMNEQINSGYSGNISLECVRDVITSQIEEL